MRKHHSEFGSMSSTRDSAALLHAQTTTAASPTTYSGKESIGRGEGAKAQPQVTHRCRLYKYHPQGLRPGKFTYTVVWDTIEDPLGNQENLPPGELLHTASDSSLDVVEEEIERICESIGEIEITDWRDFGSI